MRKHFPGYYTPTESEFQTMWREGIFSFDANVLLNLYRYTKPTSDRLLEVLNHLQDQLWLTHQAAAEYQKNRLAVISQQYDAYNKVGTDIVDAHLESIISQVKKDYTKHSGLDLPALKRIVGEASSKLHSLLDTAKKTHPEFTASDPILERVTLLFDNRLGAPYPETDLEKKYKEAQARYDKKQPPGYEDQKTKADVSKYGDAVLWFQLLDHAKQQQQPIVFVCDDRKEDWWYRHQGKTISPRPELVQEMAAIAGVPFYMYQPERFMEYAEALFDLPKLPKVIDEVREVGQQNSKIYNDIGNFYQDDMADENLSLANYGWTEFWSWARARGYHDRKSLDAVVGRPTNGMTPLEIRRAIIGRLRDTRDRRDTRKTEWDELINWLRGVGITSRAQLEAALGYNLEDMTPAEVKQEIIRRNIDIDF